MFSSTDISAIPVSSSTNWGYTGYSKSKMYDKDSYFFIIRLGIFRSAGSSIVINQSVPLLSLLRVSLLHL